jgi:eukaryotic translation initiation factor 2-alpha kinase 4
MFLFKLVDEGISEDEAWRLFLQIVDALTHMATHAILHRDIKLTNIFIGIRFVSTPP